MGGIKKPHFRPNNDENRRSCIFLMGLALNLSAQPLLGRAGGDPALQTANHTMKH
jgi:hypothetical protein